MTEEHISKARQAQRDKEIEALLAEREGYVRYKRKDRLAQVDEQLAQRGYDPDAKDGEEPKPDRTPPVGRKAAPAKATAAAKDAE